MGFDIDLKWEETSPDPVARSRRVADALLAAFPAMTEFPLEPAVIAETIGVPVADVWDHWYHVELHAPDAMAGALIHLWGESGCVELPSNPSGGCAETLAAVRPLLAALVSQGLQVVDPAGRLPSTRHNRNGSFGLPSWWAGRPDPGVAPDSDE
jgi:hypothetical protein